MSKKTKEILEKILLPINSDWAISDVRVDDFLEEVTTVRLKFMDEFSVVIFCAFSLFSAL